MASFIIGLPGETVDTMKETIDFGLSLDTFWGFNVLSPFPGTEVREKADEYGVEILTDDWNKYDANTAVTSTEGAGPEEIAEALHQFNEIFEGLLADIKRQGKLNTAEEARRGVRSPLAQTLLLDDIIEGLGDMELQGYPIEELVDRLVEIVPYTHDQIDENVRHWFDEGLLKYEIEGQRISWRWS
jgi:radical SAM superfamily enzyme YgiQ (UPF0313 family)